MLCQICVRTDDALPEVELDLTMWEREQDLWWLTMPRRYDMMDDGGGETNGSQESDGA